MILDVVALIASVCTLGFAVLTVRMNRRTRAIQRDLDRRLAEWGQ
jgi:hypothetical protein